MLVYLVCCLFCLSLLLLTVLIPDTSCHIQQPPRVPGLPRGQRPGALHQLLHHRQLPDQLRHLLRHEPSVPRDVQGAVHPWRRPGGQAERRG